MVESGPASLDPGIRRVVSRAAARLTLIAALRRAVRVAIALAAAAVVLACVARIGGFGGMPWGVIAGGLCGLVLLTLLVGLVVDRVSDHDAALVLDEHLALHDALSTTLSMEDRSGPLVQAQRAAAADVVVRRSVAAGVGRAIPVQPPRGWWVAVALAALATGIAAMPSLFGRDAPAPMDMVEAGVETETAIAQVNAALQSSPDLLARLDQGPILAVREPQADATQLRQEALQSLTELQKALDDFALDPSQQRLDGLRGRLEDLPQKPGDASEEARRALADGDFERAEKALEALQAMGNEPAAQALESLSRDLDEAGGGDERVRESLEQAGVVPERGQSPEEAVERADHLSASDRESLADLIERDASARTSLKDMAKDCQAAAKQCRGSNAPEAKANAECRKRATDQKAQKQAAACRSACAKGRARAGSGLGTSSAAAGDASSDPVAQVKAPVEVDTTAPVTGVSPVAGPLRRGDTSDAGGQAMAAAERRLQRGFDVQRLPRRYREAVAAWFRQAAARPAGEDADAGESSAAETESP